MNERLQWLLIGFGLLAMGFVNISIGVKKMGWLETVPKIPKIVQVSIVISIILLCFALLFLVLSLIWNNLQTRDYEAEVDN